MANKKCPLGFCGKSNGLGTVQVKIYPHEPSVTTFTCPYVKPWTYTLIFLMVTQVDFRLLGGGG